MSAEYPQHIFFCRIVNVSPFKSTFTMSQSRLPDDDEELGDLERDLFTIAAGSATVEVSFTDAGTPIHRTRFHTAGKAPGRKRRQQLSEHVVEGSGSLEALLSANTAEISSLKDAINSLTTVLASYEASNNRLSAQLSALTSQRISTAVMPPGPTAVSRPVGYSRPIQTISGGSQVSAPSASGTDPAINLIAARMAHLL